MQIYWIQYPTFEFISPKNMFYLETVSPKKNAHNKNLLQNVKSTVQTDLCEEYGSKVKVVKRIERDLKR